MRGRPVLEGCKYHDTRKSNTVIELFPLANVCKSSTDLVLIRSSVLGVTQRSHDSVCVLQEEEQQTAARGEPALREEAPKRLHALHKGAEAQRGA